jgi:hypothetical protein
MKPPGLAFAPTERYALFYGRVADALLLHAPTGPVVDACDQNDDTLMEKDRDPEGTRFLGAS